MSLPSVAAGVASVDSMLARGRGPILSSALTGSEVVEPGTQVRGTREASGFLPPPYILSISFRQLNLTRGGKLTRVLEPEQECELGSMSSELDKEHRV